MLLIVVCDKGNVLHIVHKNLSGNPPRSTGWKERKRPAGRNTLDFCSILCYTPLMNETLTRTICIKLDVNGHDAVLQETQQRFNAAASWIATVCWDERITNTNTAHHRVYGETRSRFALGSQLACCARAGYCSARERFSWGDAACDRSLGVRSFYHRGTLVPYPGGGG